MIFTMKDRFRFRVFSKSSNSYIKPTTDFDLFIDVDGDLYEVIYGFYNEGEDKIEYKDSDDFIIENCTGMVDRNGTLIYEGDLVRHITGKLYEIVWSDKTGSLVRHDLSKTYEDTALDSSVMKNSYDVIGNIHENIDEIEKYMSFPKNN